MGTEKNTTYGVNDGGGYDGQGDQGIPHGYAPVKANAT